VADAAALEAAWAEPDIAAQATVPPGGAERWIDGAATRREMGLSLDLVVGPTDGGEVWGEVGLAALRLTAGGAARDAIEIGWWVLPEHRGRGIATAAGRLLVRWALTDLAAARLVARIDRSSVASEAVATRIGLRRLGPLDATRDLWVVQSVPGTT
jgi:RimJ/RimL family protein N-acetyltransferase